MKLGLGKDKKEDAQTVMPVDAIEANRLRDLCGVDTDLFTGMARLMFLDPTRVKTTLDKMLNEAQDYETRGNKLRAEVAYRIAGGISLIKGDSAGVESNFSKAAAIAGDSHPEYQILVKKSQAAVAVARKFYDESASPTTLSVP
jgi:hypothetical protein